MQARRTAAIIESAKILGHGLQAQAARHLTVVLRKSFLHLQSPVWGTALLTSGLALRLMTVFNSSDSTDNQSVQKSVVR